MRSCKLFPVAAALMFALVARPSSADGRWVVDFNNAYNPACAVSPHYNCPIPTKANTFKLAIRAGEKDSHYAH